MGEAYLSNRGFILNGGGGSSVLISKNITENGTYNATDDSADGYSIVSVNVNNSDAELDEKIITVNGEYNASDDELDGYSKVTVNVPTVGLVLDYVDGNIGYISMNKYINYTMAVYFENFPFNHNAGEDLTCELCYRADSGRQRTGRYFDSNNYTIADDAIQKDGEYVYYLGVLVSDGHWVDYPNSGLEIPLPQDKDTTLSLRFTLEKLEIFVDGNIIGETDLANSTMISSYSEGRVAFMMARNMSDRDVPGHFYAARFYNRALTDAEIMHNHEQDVKLIEFLNT